ncbi:MAG: FABP family protein [Austwickia sp.]|nr:FABP family protein [Austwickia sp.]
MTFELDTTLHPSLAPLAWLVGRWEGAGLFGYPTIDDARFGQELEISHDGRPFLQHRSRSWVLDDQGEPTRPSAGEQGYWRVAPDGEVELLLVHHTGILEMFVGQRDATRPYVNLRTDAVLRSPHAKEYNAATRLYGYVESDLMWTMDMAAVGQPMTNHLSARLKRVPG